jgi:phospholipase C
MTNIDFNRRRFIGSAARAAGAAAATALLPQSIRRALAIPAYDASRSIADVKHVVILMQENRSFDHYFGTLRGVRGYGDRFPIPLASGKDVWFESDGKKEIPPYRMDRKTMNAMLIPGTPHSFSDTQAAWSQGKFGHWPKYKTPYSMGYYAREDIPFQFALAESFTICDAYHCSVASGTDPNRIVFWSGSNCNPDKRIAGLNCTDADSEPDNLRCWVKGKMPDPGYTYQGSAFTWPTLPDVLEKAGVSWRFYQDPNDNWTGAMHGCLAFESFRTAARDSSIYRNGMTHYSLDDLAHDVRNDTLPEVCWVLPSMMESEHPNAPSSPAQGGNFTARVLDALTSNPAVWSKTVFFLTFDENDGLFDHVPPPAVPSYNADGTLAGKSTVPLAGEYFLDPSRAHLQAEDTISGPLRPWGPGPRVPMYIVSPWTKGGWVDSQVFDHTSIGLFIEKRFGVTLPAISPWHRAICGDLTSAFDFATPNDPKFPALPDLSDFAEIEARSRTLPAASPPATPQPLYQEPGTRYSRALPYELHTSARVWSRNDAVALIFRNTGGQGAVFHVYDRFHLERIPRRYTVESGKELRDAWRTGDDARGNYDLWVYGPNGYLRTFKGNVPADAGIELEISYEPSSAVLHAKVSNRGIAPARVTIVSNAYRDDGPWTMDVAANSTGRRQWALAGSGNWYDFTLSANGFERRFAGRLETGQSSISDPAMGAGIP